MSIQVENFFSLNFVWNEDELNTKKKLLRSVDEKNKLNSEALFYNSWYLPILILCKILFLELFKTPKTSKTIDTSEFAN
ncbi:MAG: hypothetical protein V3V33_16340 [Candidatus Lokiarchaeia archaeon]